jgi:two-component system sensor histidine kinase YesM
MEGVRFVDSFRFKLICITIIFILFPTILYAVIYSNLVKNIISKKYSESAIQSVNEAAKNIDFVLSDISEFSNVILANRDFLKALNDIDNTDKVQFRNLLRSFFAARDGIDGIDVLVGEYFFSVGAIKVNEKADQTSTDLLSKSEGQIIWLNTRKEKIKILSGEFDKYYFSLGRKLIDINTLKELGIMTIDIDEAILAKLYSNITSSEEGEVFICKRDGVIISHSDKKRILRNIKNATYASKVLSSQDHSGYVTFKDRKIQQMAIYSTCNVNGWKIVKIIPNKYLYKEIEALQWNLIMTGIVYVLITICLALLFSIKSTGPIIGMMKLMKKAERGNLDVRINTKRKDEIGQLGLSFNNMIGEMKTLINKLVEEERQKKEIELEALHAQINPHFLYNTLNSIKWMAKIQGAKNISDAVTALIKLLRISINLGKDMILLSEEVEYVRNYILIQKLRFNERFTVEYNLDNDCLACYVPKLILQPIVENSIIYGSSNESPERLKIVIKAFRRDDLLLIEISDNGPGIKPEVLKDIFKSPKDANKFSTVGLNNIAQRIKLLYGEAYGIKIFTVENEGTNITIEIPFTKELVQGGPHV